MKKLMFATAAMAAGFAMAAGEITSANIVGYNKAATDAGNNIYRVATFEAVSGEDATFTIGQLSVGDQDFAYYNFDFIATVDPYGSQDQYYTWEPNLKGWYACDDACIVDYESPANDVELALNQAIIICSQNGIDLTCSGGVMKGDTALYGDAGNNTYTGNFTPTTITFGDIVVGEEDFAYYNFDFIATIDPYGSQDQYYTWEPDQQGWYACDDACIVDYGSPANDVEIPANMGLIFCTQNGCSLNIPSPIK